MSVDVTDIVTDPDLGGQSFLVLREREVVGDNGRVGSLSVQRLPACGSIQPASQEQLARLPDEERVGGAIMVYTPFALTAGSGAITADVVWWRDRGHTVRLADPWAFGRGYTAALCVVRPLHGETARNPVT